MKSLVQISAQYYENYNFENGGTPNWKPKGEQVFTLRADTDLFFYGEEMCIEAIKTMIASKTDRLNKFEYISHEIIFQEPMVLDEDQFETTFNQISAATNH
jgi:hypothetical protein